MHSYFRSSRLVLALAVFVAIFAAACGSSAAPSAESAQPAAAARATTAASPKTERALRIGAIPDVAPEKLLQINVALAAYFSSALGVKVEYVPVSDYAAAVSLFRAGDLDLVWFGGLTGVQARLQTPGAQVLAQRDIDIDFHSVFIVNTAKTVAPITDVAGLKTLKGLRFTFGSESSTSGRTMPEFFLSEANIDPTKDFSGPAGFSGSHDWWKMSTKSIARRWSRRAGVIWPLSPTEPCPKWRLDGRCSGSTAGRLQPGKRR